MLSGNSLRQTVHTHCAPVHQAAKLVAALLRVARVTAAWWKVMAAYHQVYNSCHLLTAKNLDQIRNFMLGNRVGQLYFYAAFISVYTVSY